MTLIYDGFTVTTWGNNEDGQQLWRVHNADKTGYFTAPDTCNELTLGLIGSVLLGLDEPAERYLIRWFNELADRRVQATE